MAHRPFNRRQRAENAAFLEALRRTGNARLAARELGVHRSTYSKRRARDAAFAQAWEMALAAAHAAFHKAGGERPAEPVIASAEGARQSRLDRRVAGAPRDDGRGLRIQGGEPVIVRLRNGKLQMRLALPGRMTKAAEQAFLRALSASANVRLSAAAAGFSHASFYWRKRCSAPFARDMRFAVTIACDRLEWALDERAFQLFGEGAPWRDGAFEDNPLPPMTVGECIHLVTLHQNRDRLRRTVDRGRRTRAPFEDTEGGFAARRAAAERARHYEATGSWRFPHEPEPPELPPLHLVTGWSKAKGEPAHNPDVALFGGWRLSDWGKRKKRR